MQWRTFGLAVILGLGLSSAGSGSLPAASQMSEAEFRALLDGCKQLATPQLKDECVSNAKNRYERGQGAEKKAGDMTDKAKGGKDKAMGQSDAGMKAMKGAKDKGGQMMKGKAKTN